jgi:hypothetical protein
MRKNLNGNKKRWGITLMALLILSSVFFFVFSSRSSASVLFKEGSITVPSSNGNHAYTGIGFQPKAILLFGNRRSADGTSSTNTQNADMTTNILGMATSSTKRQTVYNTDDFTGGGPTTSTTEILHVSANSGITSYTADFVSMDSDGFTLNFTAANATAYIVNYIAIGGSNISANIIQFDTPLATGNQAKTGVGFQPDSMVLIGGTASGTNSTRGVGFVSGTSSQVSSSANFDGGVSCVCAADYQRNNKAFVEVGGTSLKNEATLTSFDSDGFTLNFSTTDAGSTHMAALCLKGARFKAGSFTQKTSTGNQATTGVGFQPIGLLISTVNQAASTSVMNPAQYESFTGAADSTSQASSNVTASLSHGNTDLDRTKIYTSLADDATPTVQAAASLSSFDTDGFTLNYTTADATAREIIYFAFGPAITSTAPAAPTLSSPADTATSVSTTPQFTFKTTDPDSDYLRYKIEVCSTSNCSSIVRTIDQTSSQTGWSGQDQQGSTAYTGSTLLSGSTLATHDYQAAALSSSTQYWWRVYAIDPAGSNIFSSVSGIFSFTTAGSNASPAAPTLIYPSSGATAVSNLPIFQLRTTDANNDYLMYFIQIYDATACGGSQVGSDIDQTSSQTNWQGQDTTGATAYVGSSTLASSTIARYQFSGTPLTNNHLYSWRAKAKDPGGSNAFGSLSGCSDFTTGNAAVEINGGTQINGGTTIQ